MTRHPSCEIASIRHHSGASKLLSLIATLWIHNRYRQGNLLPKSQNTKMALSHYSDAQSTKHTRKLNMGLDVSSALVPMWYKHSRSLSMQYLPMKKISVRLKKPKQVR